MAQELARKPDTGERFRQPNSPSWTDKYVGADYGSAGAMGIQDLIAGLVNLAKAPFAAGGAAAGAMAGTPAGQNPMGNISQAIGESLGPNAKLMKGLIDKQKKGHAEEALMQLGPQNAMAAAQNLDQQEVGTQAPANLNTALANPQPGSPGIAAGPQQPVMQKSQGFFDPGAYDPAANTMRMPGGFMNGWGLDRIAKQQQLMSNQQKIAGQEPIQPKDFMDNNIKLLVASLSKDGKLSDAQKNLDAYNTFGEKMVATMDAYQNLKDHGKTGPISGNLAKLASTFGPGDPDLSEFDSLMTGLTFAGANFLAQQSGRSMSDADFKNVQKMITLKNTSKDNTVRGKMQSVISQLNAAVPAGGKKLPDVGTLINEIKKARQSQNQQSSQATQSTGKQTVGRFQVEYHG